MIPGTGPSRGIPWWRRVRLDLWHYVWGEIEPVGHRREGRTVAIIGEMEKT